MIFFSIFLFFTTCQNDVSSSSVNYQVFLKGQTSSGDLTFTCSGVLISPKYILTAANCVEGGGTLYVTLTDGTQVTSLSINRAIPHDKYHWYYFSNDIALIEIPNPRDDYNSFAQLPQIQGEDYKGVATVYTSQREPVKVRIIPSATCSKIYEQSEHTILNWDFKICAQIITNDNSSLLIESGDPLVISSRKVGSIVIGLVSFGVRNSNMPIGFTKLSGYLDWIFELSDFGVGNI